MSSRSVAELQESKIVAAVESSDLVVWGGDLFDFRWAHFAKEEKAIEYSLDYLHSWQNRFPKHQFAFLCGNHDANKRFLEAVKRFATRQPNFHFVGDVLRIGNTVMLHGDQIEGRGCVDRFARYRRRWADKPRVQTWRFAPYDAAVAARMHLATAAIAHRNRLAIRRLATYLHLHNLDSEQGIERVVFGHTHRVVKNFPFAGMEFSSGGAAIRHCKFEPVVSEFS